MLSWVVLSADGVDILHKRIEINLDRVVFQVRAARGAQSTATSPNAGSVLALSSVIVDGGAPSSALDRAARIDCVSFCVRAEGLQRGRPVCTAVSAPILWIVGSYSGGKLTVAPQ